MPLPEDVVAADPHPHRPAVSAAHDGSLLDFGHPPHGARQGSTATARRPVHSLDQHDQSVQVVGQPGVILRHPHPNRRIMGRFQTSQAKAETAKLDTREIITTTIGLDVTWV